MIAAAERFLATHARILDRRRFERLFHDGPAGPVRDAVAAYRNPDGGFGHALEPDGRAPGSQPAAVALALRTVHEAGAWDADLAEGVLGWLEAHEAPGGGVCFVDPGIEGWPAAPWWIAEPGLPPSLVSTGPIAGTLLAEGVEHPWLERAVAWLWNAVGAATQEYELRGALAFLASAPDEDRAVDALRGLGGRLQQVLSPLDVAPLPGSRARVLLEPDAIEMGLDGLAAAQADDGGWRFEWPAWSDVAAAEWRGSVTVDALAILQANGRRLSVR